MSSRATELLEANSMQRSEVYRQHHCCVKWRC